MNFISHFYTEQDEHLPYYMTGIALPDLTRNANPHVRIRGHHTETRFAEEELVQINAGVKRHLEVDALFHSSSFFKTNTEYIIGLFKKESWETVHRFHFAMAHVLLEMMLDRMLIKDHPQLCSQFYTTLNAVNEKYIEKYLKSLNFVETQFRSAEFGRYFQRFRQAQYLRDYIHNEPLIFALEKVFARVNRQPFTVHDKRKLNHIIIEAENYLSGHYSDIFNEIICYEKA